MARVTGDIEQGIYATLAKHVQGELEALGLDLVLFNLGQALFFMMTDKEGSKRTVWALTRRIGLSVLLILMVVLGIWMGWLHPHGVGQ